MPSTKQNAWLFGPLPDLLLGAGMLYLLIMAGLIAWGTGAREALPAYWLSYLVLIFSGSHYGGTLLRVYEHSAERRTYQLFTVYGTVVMLAALVGALYSPFAGSLLITLYLTWSPWHYTGQNYGIAVMFLRRRGVEITPAAKRWLYASFVCSFLPVFLNFHFEGGVSQADPLGYTAFSTSGYQFYSLGLPSEIRTILLPVVGLCYAGSMLAAGTLLSRSGSLREIAPTAVVMLTQAVWFSIPHLGTLFGLGALVPALDAVGGQSFQFYFLWTAVGHAVQYLWITAYYAHADERWRGYGPYFTKVFVLGNAVWAAPLLFFGPDLLGRPDYESGLAMSVAAAVNLHHFMLDGAIWKLRNPRIAAVLLRSQPGVSEGPTHSAGALWRRRVVWTLAGLFCLAKVVPYIEVDWRFPNAMIHQDYATAASILDRAAFYGRDSAASRIHLANRLVKTQDPMRAIRHYWRSLKFNPHAFGYAELGVLSGKLSGDEAAIATWKRGLAAFPDDFDLNRHMGIGLLKLERANAALPYLERAFELRPGDERTLAARATARARVGR